MLEYFLYWLLGMFITGLVMGGITLLLAKFRVFERHYERILEKEEKK